MPRSSPALREILTLDPVRDHQRITFLTCRCDFPFDTTRALEFALFRTFCVPSIGALLDRTGEFGQRSQRRYDDTDLIISEIMEHGYDSDRGSRAIARMNSIHGRFKISNADFLYVLSTFVFEPIRWFQRFGWRPLSPAEPTALFHFWREVGARMHIADIPPGADDFERYNRDYERTHFRPNPGSQRVAAATTRMFAGWAGPLRGIVPPIIAALMDDPLRCALELPAPSPALRSTVAAALRIRGHLGHLLSPRSRPELRTAGRHRSYPCGYKIENLGPPGNPEP
jgi:ER-bound oxygenase mpaB/B'/Rubber oxygenase, catalytic domain